MLHSPIELLSTHDCTDAFNFVKLEKGSNEPLKGYRNCWLERQRYDDYKIFFITKTLFCGLPCEVYNFEFIIHVCAILAWVVGKTLLFF